MKKVVPVIVAIILVGGLVTAFVVGTFKFMDSKTAKTDLSSYGEEFNNPSLKFTGKSKHYSFKLGRAVFDDNKKSILVAEILQTKSIDYLKKETLVIKFGGKEYKRINNTTKLNSLKNPLEILTFHDSQDICNNGDENCNNYEIQIPDESSFKKNFEVGIEYCTTEGKCTYEKLKLNYNGIF